MYTAFHKNGYQTNLGIVQIMLVFGQGLFCCTLEGIGLVQRNEANAQRDWINSLR